MGRRGDGAAEAAMAVLARAFALTELKPSRLRRRHSLLCFKVHPSLSSIYATILLGAQTHAGAECTRSPTATLLTRRTGQVERDA
ncbi:hypothetical protein MRB53_040758 [Persea americana]|nr:hypothetical protein MRB53_040758 [Persea americana]